MNPGGFTGNFHGGRPMYHPMDEVDLDIQQWSELPQSPYLPLIFTTTALPRRTATKWTEHSWWPGPRITLKTQWKRCVSRTRRARWSWRLHSETSTYLVIVESVV